MQDTLYILYNTSYVHCTLYIVQHNTLVPALKSGFIPPAALVTIRALTPIRDMICIGATVCRGWEGWRCDIRRGYRTLYSHTVTYEIVGVVNFLKLATFSLPIRSIFVKSIPKLFSIKYFITLLL